MLRLLCDFVLGGFEISEVSMSPSFKPLGFHTVDDRNPALP